MLTAEYGIPERVLEEMCFNSSKTARLSAIFTPKHAQQFRWCGVPYICITTKRWIISTVVVQLVVWTICSLVAALAAYSEHIPFYLLGILAPLFLAAHIFGYFSFVYRKSQWGAIYCASLFVVAIIGFIEVLALVRRSQHIPMGIALGALVSLSFLFFLSANLILILRDEAKEISILLPVEVLDERPSETPLLRWYFSLPTFSSERNEEPLRFTSPSARNCESTSQNAIKRIGQLRISNHSSNTDSDTTDSLSGDNDNDNSYDSISYDLISGR